MSGFAASGGDEPAGHHRATERSGIDPWRDDSRKDVVESFSGR
jgi:hypothetical protein